MTEVDLPRRRFFSRTWIALCVLVIFLAGGLRLRASGPFRARFAPTILSHTGATPETSERAILFLRAVDRRAPKGASIALVRPGHDEARDRENAYMTAVGFLPCCRVVDASRIASDSPPELVASFERPFPDPRYGPPERLEFGFLSRRR